MSWLPQAEAIGQFLQGHIPFDIALGIVILMFTLSVIFRLANRPMRTANDPSIMKALEGFKERGDADQLTLLWDYTIHADDNLNDRQNFFLFFESVLLGGTFAVLAASTQSTNEKLHAVVAGVALLGVLTTFFWWYIQLRQGYILSCMTEFHKRVTPVYKEVIMHVRERTYRIGATVILVYVLPLLVGLLWTAILFYA